MLLAIDSGNTNVVCAVYDGDDLRGSWRAGTNPNRTADEYAVWLVQLMALAGLGPSDIDATIIGSVVPEATHNLARLCERYFSCEPLIVGRSDCSVGIGIDLDMPREEVGADRIAQRRSAAAERRWAQHRSGDAIRCLLGLRRPDRRSSPPYQGRAQRGNGSDFHRRSGAADRRRDRCHKPSRSRSDLMGTAPDLPTKPQQMNHLPLQSGTRQEYRDPNALYFVPLGGTGEIGMNLNVYGYAGDWLIIDCGVTFGDDTQPGIEVVMPDPGFIVERRDRLLGIVATHAHEDHIGAIPYLWTQLRCPIW